MVNVNININQHPSRSDAIDFTVSRHPFTQYRIGSGVGYRVGMGWGVSYMPASAIGREKFEREKY